MIVDYPWARPGGAALKAAGVTGVLRYLSHDVTKSLLRPEADDLAAHGISMAVVYEDLATRAGEGYTAGAIDAATAVKMANGTQPKYTDLAMPSDRPIYLAADFDASWPQVAPYYAGAASILGQDRVGVYGGLAVISGAANAGYRWLWQAAAWSHGQWHPKATLHQPIQETTINGAQCDVDVAMTSDWGQWIPGGEADMVSDQDKHDIAKLAAQMVWDTIIKNDAGALTASTHLGRANVFSDIDRKGIADLQAKLAQVIALLPPAKP